MKTEIQKKQSKTILNNKMLVVLNKPELTSSKMGVSMKFIQVRGLAGMTMPPHYSTKEAVIVVEEGRAVLKMPESEHILKQGSTFIVPAGKEHPLTIQENIKAIDIMAVDSEIDFI